MKPGHDLALLLCVAAGVNARDVKSISFRYDCAQGGEFEIVCHARDAHGRLQIDDATKTIKQTMKRYRLVDKIDEATQVASDPRAEYAATPYRGG